MGGTAGARRPKKGLAVDFIWQDMSHASFWMAVLQIIFVNIILSGDNAVVIAMACLTLPPKQRLWGMILGAGVAVLLRVVFTLVIAQAMAYPFLKLVGGALLFMSRSSSLPRMPTAMKKVLKGRKRFGE